MRTLIPAFCLSLLLVGVAPAADSLNVRLVGSYSTSDMALGMDIKGDYAYVADGAAGLRVITVTDPAHPVEVGYCDTPDYAYGVAVSGSYAYVADADSGLRVISVTDPAHPVEVGYYDTPGLAHGVAVIGDYAYVGDESAGLQIYQFYGAGVEETPNAEVRTADPMPTIVRGVLVLGAVDGRQQSGYRAELLDAAGRRVMGLKAGANDVRALAPGVYFVRDAQAQAVRKVVITR